MHPNLSKELISKRSKEFYKLCLCVFDFKRIQILCAFLRVFEETTVKKFVLSIFGLIINIKEKKKVRAQKATNREDIPTRRIETPTNMQTRERTRRVRTSISNQLSQILYIQILPKMSPHFLTKVLWKKDYKKSSLSDPLFLRNYVFKLGVKSKAG